MNRKGLAVLMRTRMKPDANQLLPMPPPPPPPPPILPEVDSVLDGGRESSCSSQRVTLKDVKEWMQASISFPTNKSEFIDATLERFSQGYLSLPEQGRRELLLALARDFDVNRAPVRELMEQYLTIEIPHAAAVRDQQPHGIEEDGLLAALYRTERNLRDALKPMYALFFERLNERPGGLKILTTLRSDLLSVLANENIPSLRALDSYLKEKLITWLSPAALELHQITWDDSASLLEKIVENEAVHPIRSLLDLKRRLSVGRRCFGYLHPAMPGEPLIFIEVALLKNVAKSIQEVLWDDPPMPECETTCALFYSISSTQMYATLSPIPGYMPWLLSKLASQIKLAQPESKDMTYFSQDGSGSTLKEDILFPEEERMILESVVDRTTGKSGMELIHQILTSTNSDWTKSEQLLVALKPSLMRLCARYLLRETKRGKALDPVANFHLQNGAMIERINWMADPSEKGIKQSGGIMVNYVYRSDKIDENAQSYFSSRHIHASCGLHQYLEGSSHLA